MSLAASMSSILIILLSSFVPVHFCRSLPVTRISEKFPCAKSNPTNAMQTSYLVPETVKGHVLKNTDDVTKSILSKNEQWKYFTVSKEENNQEEMKYKSIKGWRKLIVGVSETKAKSNRESSHGGHKKKRGRGIDIDYDPPKTHPPSHN